MSRECPTAVLKKAYRNLSLELHPDKNKSPEAPDQFLKVKHAFDVLLNPDTRQIYDRLGDAGVKVSAQTVIDHKYIIIQMLVYYFSSMIFAFLMTFAEPSGDAMTTSFFGLIGMVVLLTYFAHLSLISYVSELICISPPLFFSLSAMLLIECALILEHVKIPVWLLSRNTSYDVVSLLHRLYPAFMNGCRCIVGAFVIDHKNRRVEALQDLSDSIRVMTAKATSVIQGTEKIARTVMESANMNDNDDSVSVGIKKGVEKISMLEALRSIQRNNTFESIISGIKLKAAMILNPALLRQQEKSSVDYSWLRNITIYLIARFILVKSTILSKRSVS